jgi:hypothetical protein
MDSSGRHFHKAGCSDGGVLNLDTLAIESLCVSTGSFGFITPNLMAGKARARRHFASRSFAALLSSELRSSPGLFKSLEGCA